MSRFIRNLFIFAVLFLVVFGVSGLFYGLRIKEIIWTFAGIGAFFAVGFVVFWLASRGVRFTTWPVVIWRFLRNLGQKTFGYRVYSLFVIPAVPLLYISVVHLRFDVLGRRESFFWQLCFFGLLVLMYAGSFSLIVKAASLLFDDMRMSRIPTSKACLTSPGLVEISGQIRPVRNEEKLMAPFSDVPCVYYESAIFQAVFNKRDPDGENLIDFQRTDMEEDRIPFVLEDDSGAILVDPSGAEFVFETDLWEVVTGGHGGDLPEDVEAQQGKETTLKGEGHGIDGVTRRYEESVAEVGESVFVIGQARPLSRTRFEKKDVTENGNATEPLCLKEMQETGRLIISDRSEKTLRSERRTKAILFLLTGLITTPLLLYVIYQYFTIPQELF